MQRYGSSKWGHETFEIVEKNAVLNSSLGIVSLDEIISTGLEEVQAVRADAAMDIPRQSDSSLLSESLQAFFDSRVGPAVPVEALRETGFVPVVVSDQSGNALVAGALAEAGVWVIVPTAADKRAAMMAGLILSPGAQERIVALDEVALEREDPSIALRTAVRWITDRLLVPGFGLRILSDWPEERLSAALGRLQVDGRSIAYEGGLTLERILKILNAADWLKEFVRSELFQQAHRSWDDLRRYYQ